MYRSKHMSARDALAHAREDVAKGIARYPAERAGSNKPFKAYGGTMLWIEKPADMGLRVVGHADEIARIDHKGWFLHDDDCGDTVRGIVMQLPGRSKRPLFLAGYADPHNDGPVCVDIGTVWKGEAPFWATVPGPGKERCGYWTWSDNPREHDGARSAAYEADRIASRMAEAEREYNRAWDAGAMWREAVDELKKERESVRALLAERKAARANAESFPAICAVLRAAITSSLRTISELRERRDILASGDYETRHAYYGFSLNDPAQVDAFNDGAGEVVIC